MLWKRIRQAFQIQKLPSTLTILISFIGSVILTVLSFLNKIDDATKLSGLLAILTFLAFSEVLERLVSLTRMEEDIADIKSYLGKGAEQIIMASEFTPFERFVADGKDIFIIGTTKVGYISNRENFFISLLKRGAKVRIILLDPKEENLYTVVSRNMTVGAARLLSDINSAIAGIKDIREHISSKENSRLNLALYPGSLGIGLLLVDSNKPTGRLQIYFYPYKTSPPERVGFEIRRENNPKWFDYFAQKYENLWKDIASDQIQDPTLQEAEDNAA